MPWDYGPSGVEYGSPDVDPGPAVIALALHQGAVQGLHEPVAVAERVNVTYGHRDLPVP